jgi:tRNA-dihydrouridine synthase
MTTPLLAAAPMEGLTTFVFRQVHAAHFGGADEYWLPFVTPTDIPKFTERQMHELRPEVNKGFKAVPQLLTKNAKDFIWAAKALSDLGYEEVNLNLGCPSGTVAAKGKGAGFLLHPDLLDQFFDEIFSARLPIPVSVKTRLGWASEDEFDRLVTIYNRYPIKTLIVHPRLKKDLYRGAVRLETLDRLYPQIKTPIGYNGDIVTPEDCRRTEERYPNLALIMVGRALMADPALFRKIKGGAPASREEIIDFQRELYERYAEAWGSVKNAVMRMKEYWFYQLNLFEGAEKAGKAIFKAKTLQEFQAAADNVLENFPLRESAAYGWFKPLN